MNTPLFPAFYFPPILYFLKLKEFNEVLIEKEESYSKQTYRNRCYILGPNGKQSLTVPVKNGESKKFDSISIAYENKWVLEHIRSIETAYNNAPYFIYYWDKYKQLLKNETDKLLDLNLKILKENLKDLNLNVNFKQTNHYQHEARHDFRKCFNAKQNKEIQGLNYMQVFSDKFGFTSNLSVLDLLFNLGPEAAVYIKNFKISII